MIALEGESDWVPIWDAQPEGEEWRSAYQVHVRVAGRSQLAQWLHAADLSEAQERARQRKAQVALGLPEDGGRIPGPEAQARTLDLTRQLFDLCLLGARGTVGRTGSVDLSTLQGRALQDVLLSAGLSADVRAACLRYQSPTTAQRRALPGPRVEPVSGAGGSRGG